MSASATETSRQVEAPTAAHSAECLNCGARLSGPFCSACGQRDIPPYPSVRDLAVDAFWELSGWDGRFFTTVRALVRRPGLLTREFLEGRRARYISPLRLYLMASLVYFLVAAATPEVQTDSGKTIFFGPHLKLSQPPDSAGSRPQRVANAASESLRASQARDSAANAEVLADIAEAPGFLQPFLRRAVNDPDGLQDSFFRAMPRMLFALLPVFACIVALFYRGRKYPEHLYFAIHLHALLFLALTLSELPAFTQSAVFLSVAKFLTVAWIPIYSTLAFRRVYGGSVRRTLAKEVAIGTIYGVTSMFALMLTVYVVSIVG
jgi:hypothetical protein